MGIGHQKQISFEKINWKYRYCHGGLLRNKRSGRKARPISTRDYIHVVFKLDKIKIRNNFKSNSGLRSLQGHQICTTNIKKYAQKFHLKISQQAICNDHIHMIIRVPKRALAQHFFRVVSGQISQQFKNNGLCVTDTPQKLWQHRPYTRIIKGWKSYLLTKAYVVLNEKEAQGLIVYKPNRLRGLRPEEWFK